MVQRTIAVSRCPAHLSNRHKQLVLRVEDKEIDSIPMEDIGIVVVDNPNASFSQRCLASLATAGAVVLICDEKHLPIGMLLPMTRHTNLVSRLSIQIELSKARRKKIWAQIVAEKIRAQARSFSEDSPPYGKLQGIARQVRSGDPDNREAYAAQVYWKHIFGETRFKRDRTDGEVNGLLNYGYAIMRAILARAVISSGLNAAIGVNHSNRSNPFCLIDDLIEPLRPMIDRIVVNLVRNGITEVCPSSKKTLLQIPTETCGFNGETGPLETVVQKYVSSYVAVISGERTDLQFPEFVGLGELHETERV